MWFVYGSTIYVILHSLSAYRRHLETHSETLHKDHHRDEENVVFIHRWSLYAGGLYKQVAFIYRWSLEQVSLYIHDSNRFITTYSNCIMKRVSGYSESYMQFVTKIRLTTQCLL